MDLQQHLSALKELANQASKEASLAIRIPAANKLLATTKNRIVVDGKATDNSKIGNYSTKPEYFGRGQFVVKGAFRAKGKTGAAKFSNGEPHKSMYLNKGYAEFRDIQGRESGFVNANLSGELMLTYISVGEKDGVINQGLNKQKSADKRAGLESRFKPFMASSKQELDEYNKECFVGFSELTIKTLKR